MTMNFCGVDVREEQRTPRVYLCVPVYKQLYSHYLLPYSKFLIDCVKSGLICGLETPMEKLIPQARNEAGEEARRFGATHLMFLDDDVCPPPDALKRLLEFSDASTVVGGLYHNSEGLPVAYDSLSPLKHTTLEYEVVEVGKFRQRDEPVKVAALGMGCTLIPMTVLEQMEYPWFSTEYRRVGSNPSASALSVALDAMTAASRELVAAQGNAEIQKQCAVLSAATETYQQRLREFVSGPVTYLPGISQGEPPRYEFVGEDIWFFEHAEKAGVRVLLHCGVRCGHLKQEAK